MTRFLVTCAIGCAALASAAVAQSPGLTLNVTGGRLGDAASLQITGFPLAPGLLGIDTAAGPTMSPIGPLSLGLTSQLQIFPFTFDSNGQFGVAGVLPADPGFSGLTLFMQAVAVTGSPINPSAPLGSSNGASLTLTSPKLIIVDPGVVWTPWGPATPGSFCVYDALTDTPVSPAVPLESQVKQALSISQQGLVALHLVNGTVKVFDSNTAALVATIVPPSGTAGPGSPHKIVSDGVSLYVLYQGFMSGFWGPGAPGVVRAYALPSGTLVQTMPLAAGNPDDLLFVPGSNVGYLRLQAPYTIGSSSPTEALPIDLTTGATLPVINLGGTYGGISEWTLDNGIVYCLMNGSLTTFPPTTIPERALSAFSTITNAPLFTSPVALAGLISPYSLRRGPGTGGSPALFVQNGASLYEISPTTLNVINTVSLTGSLFDMRLSGGGTEWLLLIDAAGQKQLATMAPPVLVPTPLATLPGTTQYFVTPLASATVFKAYVAQSSSSISPFATDPSVPPTASVGLPVSSPSYLVLSN